MITSDDVYFKSSIRKTAIRIIKKVPGIYGMIEAKFKADFEVKIADNPNLYYEVPNEFVVYIEHELKCEKSLVQGALKLFNDVEITAIILEKQYIPFEIQGEEVKFSFDVKGLKGPTSTLSIHTRFEEPGLHIRLEHNHIGRKAGKYGDIPYPKTQIEAAHHYIMGMREIVRMIEIPEYLTKNNLGYMYVLGFETNNEIHTDFPPHWHLIYRWESFIGSQAPHLYLGERGETTHNLCYIDGIVNFSRNFESNEWCKFVDYRGADVCALSVRKEGGVSLTKPGGDMYHMSDYTEDGVVIYQNDTIIGRIQVKDRVEEGIYEVRWSKIGNVKAPENYCQRIIYDPLTGAMLENRVGKGK